MHLKEKMSQDLIGASRAKDGLRVSTLRMALAAIHNREIELKKKEEGLSEEEVIEVLSTEIKKRKEAEVQYEKGGRQDLVEKERSERAILTTYMPEQLSEEEIRRLAKEAMDHAGAKTPQDFGKVMGVLMPQVKGRADGQIVSQIVRELLTPKE